MYKALKPKDRERAVEMFNIVFLNDEMRNRNPLHVQILDSCVIGNLLNFPKHIFGFPIGSYATDGNESLSLSLFAYREQRHRTNPLILYVGGAESAESAEEQLLEVRLCVERLGMEFAVVGMESGNCQDTLGKDRDRLVAVMTSFESPMLGMVADWCEGNGIGLHLHIRDAEWRKIFQLNKKPVHFQLPTGVQSISIEEGLLNSGYSLYRDIKLRDWHLDVGLAWQAGYMSPNEGGSGESAPLFMDFCFILLGWSALTYMAERELGFRTLKDRSSYRLFPTLVHPGTASLVKVPKMSSYETILAWAQTAMDPETGLSREELESELVGFQLEFLGGKARALEAMCTGGGTRSINMAFESVLQRARTQGRGPFKIITGNPHLAVERAERRFGFQLTRVDVDGILSVERLRHEIEDPTVIAVYTQTLSYTDGTTDPLPEILQLIEAQNRKREGVPDWLPITLINDCCLAFAVLAINDGSQSSSSMRVLDLTASCITPTIA